MTDGTSQGLFIVVAIVIFGIFVVMAYILFEDTLSPAMASMFTNATETANIRIGNVENSENILDYSKLTSFNPYYTDYTVDGNIITLTAVKPDYIVLYFEEPNEKLISGREYKISGYLYIDGQPAKVKNWLTKKVSTHYTDSNFKIDNDTGYFEETYTYKYTEGNLVHARVINENGTNFSAGTKISIKDLKLTELTNR